jgi:hypothetical protein
MCLLVCVAMVYGLQKIRKESAEGEGEKSKKSQDAAEGAPKKKKSKPKPAADGAATGEK